MSNKLDRLVAEKVMGWTVRESDPDDNDYERYSSGWAVCKWCPSTDIAYAWEVVEHLRKQRSSYDAPKDPTWRVSLTGSGDRWICDVADWRERLDVAACDSDPRMAICWAALRAFKVPESDIQEAK